VLAQGAVVERSLDRSGERISRQGAVGQRRWRETALSKEACPGELVDDERRDDGGLAGSQGGACRAGPAVMDDRRHAWKQPVVRRLVEREDGGR